MNFAQTVQAVMDITKRPDKQIETERAVNAAISFFTINAEFQQDILVHEFTISPTALEGSVDLAVLTNFRRFLNVNPKGLNRRLAVVSPEDIYTPGGFSQTNIYYISTDKMYYVLSELCTEGKLQTQYYLYPADLSGNQEYWFLNLANSCVQYKAASTIFQYIGDDSSMQINALLASEFYISFVRDQVQAQPQLRAHLDKIQKQHEQLQQMSNTGNTGNTGI